MDFFGGRSKGSNPIYCAAIGQPAIALAIGMKSGANLAECPAGKVLSSNGTLVNDGATLLTASTSMTAMLAN